MSSQKRGTACGTAFRSTAARVAHTALSLSPSLRFSLSVSLSRSLALALPFPLQGSTVEPDADHAGEDHCFTLTTNGGKKIHLSASSGKDRDSWMAGLRATFKRQAMISTHSAGRTGTAAAIAEKTSGIAETGRNALKALLRREDEEGGGGSSRARGGSRSGGGKGDTRNCIAASPRSVCLVKAMYDCEGEAPGELTFVEGQIFELIGKTCPHGEGWWIGKTAAGKMGIFPENYVEVRFAACVGSIARAHPCDSQPHCPAVPPRRLIIIAPSHPRFSRDSSRQFPGQSPRHRRQCRNAKRA